MPGENAARQGRPPSPGVPRQREEPAGQLPTCDVGAERILLVRHSSPHARLVTALLARAAPAAAVVVVSTVADAVAALDARRFDVVLADLALADASGLDVVTALSARRPAVPLVVLTGADDEQFAACALALAAHDYPAASAVPEYRVATFPRERVGSAVVTRDREHDAGAQSLLDALESATCAVDATGRITAVNAAWERTAAAGSTPLDVVGVGVDYLAVCDTVEGEDADTAREVAGGLRSVLAGRHPRFEAEYPCDLPGGRRWFSVRVNALPNGGGAVLSHVDITDLVRARELISHQALHDPLTGLPNRQLLFDRLDQALERRVRHDGDVAVLFCDLDNFKDVNDCRGHAVGDELLRVVAARIRAAVRPEDTVARLGGDEFVVICEGMVDAGPVAVAERIHVALRPGVLLPGQERAVRTAVSIGIATAPPVRSADELLAAADAAMYRAKQHGRARTEVFDEALRAAATHRLQLVADLRLAFGRGQLRLHHQPVVDLSSGHVVGLEALVRWVHPELGMLRPEAFRSAAEQGHLAGELSRWVLTGTVALLREHPVVRRLGLWAAMDVSAAHLVDGNLLDDVAAAVAQAGVAPDRLVVEFSESALVRDTALTSAVLAGLSGIGVRVAIDDFGIGRRNLAHLTRFPVDFVKVDAAFVAGVGVDDDDSAIVASVVDLAHEIGAAAVAEGVERPGQLAVLRQFGCDLAQGLLWSPAVPAEHLDAAVVEAPVLAAATGSRLAEPDPEVRRRIMALHRGGASLDAIAAALNDDDLLTPRGTRWRAESVARVVSDEVFPSVRVAPAAPRRRDHRP